MLSFRKLIWVCRLYTFKKHGQKRENSCLYALLLWHLLAISTAHLIDTLCQSKEIQMFISCICSLRKYVPCLYICIMKKNPTQKSNSCPSEPCHCRHLFMKYKINFCNAYAYNIVRLHPLQDLTPCSESRLFCHRLGLNFAPSIKLKSTHINLFS